MVTAALDRPAAGGVERPAGIRRWLTSAERRANRGPAGARLALDRAQGERSPSAGIVDTWLAGLDNDNTREAYATDLRLFVEWLRDRHEVDDDVPVNLLAVTYEVAAAYADAMRATVGRYGDPLSAQTRARRVSSLRALYRHLAVRRDVTMNPVVDLPRPRVDATGTTPARSEAELSAMLVAAAEAGTRELALMLLFSSTALRVSELTRARVEDMAYAGGRCLLSVRLKGGKRREVPLDPAVCQVLDLDLDGREAGPLFDNRRAGRAGVALTRGQVAYMLARLARAAGLADPHALTPHVIRTSAATHWLESGVPLQRVQHKLNHASPGTTQRYHRRARGIADDAALGASLLAELDVDTAFRILTTEGTDP